MQSLSPNEGFEAAFSATRFSDWQLNDLLVFWDNHHAHTSEERLLFILDDKKQAAYTSFCVLTSGPRLGRFDMTALTPQDLAEFNERNHLSPHRQAAVVRANLKPLLTDLNFDGTWASISLDCDLVATNRDPALAFGQTALALHVPVTHPSEALFGAPNGYFTGDLTPAHNFVLAEHLRLNHAYELMGLGANLIGFIRPEPADEDDVAAVLESVAWLYCGWNDTSGEWHDPVPGLMASIVGSRLLFLSYRGA